jgi:hypothetical protein
MSDIFRRAALDRLASPERLDGRLALPSYPRGLVIVLALLLALVAGFAAWLLSGR